MCSAGGLHFSTLPHTEIEAAASRGDIYQIAVHADLPDVNLRRGGPCPVHKSLPTADDATIARDFATPNAIFFHTCDTGGGSSGSPLLIDTTNGPEVVAINVGTYILSRTVTTAGVATGHDISEPIANTAISITPVALATLQLAGREQATTAPNVSFEIILGRHRSARRRPFDQLGSAREWPSVSHAQPR